MRITRAMLTLRTNPAFESPFKTDLYFDSDDGDAIYAEVKKRFKDCEIITCILTHVDIPENRSDIEIIHLND